MAKIGKNENFPKNGILASLYPNLEMRLWNTMHFQLKPMIQFWLKVQKPWSMGIWVNFGLFLAHFLKNKIFSQTYSFHWNEEEPIVYDFKPFLAETNDSILIKSLRTLIEVILTNLGPLRGPK